MITGSLTDKKERVYAGFAARNSLLESMDAGFAKSELAHESGLQTYAPADIDDYWQSTYSVTVSRVPEVLPSDIGTGVTYEVRNDKVGMRFVAAETEFTLDKLAKENNARIALLARRFASADGLSTEENARLAIATERVRAMLPAATASDYEWLAETIDRVQAREKTAQELRAQFAALESDGD